MKRRLEKISRCPGVSQILVFDDDQKRWINPQRGAKYRSSKYVRDSDGRLKKVGRYFDTLDEAIEFRNVSEQEKTSDSRPETPTPKAGERLTFGQLAKIWEQTWLPSKSHSTQLRYRLYLKHFDFFWPMKVDKIEPSDIDRWLVEVKSPEYLAKGHSTRCDFKHEFTVLRIILNFYASRFDRNYRLPFVKDHKSMLKVREKLKVTKDLNVEEIQKFISELRSVCLEFDCEVVYYVGLMQYATYCRIQETAALHFEDFDFQRNILTVKRKVQWARARGHQDRIVDGNKANGGKQLPIPGMAADVFREWVKKSGVRSGLLFTTDGTSHLSYRQIEYRYSQALKRIGSQFRATHLLRHASLCEFYATSKDLLLTAKMAGQSDIRTTQKYAKARREDLISMQKIMDEKLSKLVL
jgi:integrase